ncbi:MAG: hypothetical protein H0V84_04840, partial [Actinobacteria bacterium]|nr:hypothetical protein [Actinomycetota bacterium]
MALMRSGGAGFRRLTSDRHWDMSPSWRSQGDESCTVRGTEADDVLRGTPGPDHLCGLEGDDTLRAGSGDDVLEGGIGIDL